MRERSSGWAAKRANRLALKVEELDEIDVSDKGDNRLLCVARDRTYLVILPEIHRSRRDGRAGDCTPEDMWKELASKSSLSTGIRTSVAC